MLSSSDQCDAQDVYWMKQALLQAEKAFLLDEVPVGAVVVHEGELISEAHNAPIVEHDPSAHAEIRALRLAGQRLQNYRLQGCTVYVTLEPCAMCAMALLHARVGRVVFGAFDVKTGAAGSVLNIFSVNQLNHQTEIEGGVLANECTELLKRFFSKKRIKPAFPLRDDALRTAEKIFAELGVVEGAYTNSLQSLQGLRLHYYHSLSSSLDDVSHVVLCLHDLNGYAVQFLEWLSEPLCSKQCVLAPDLIGFGRSDKPKKRLWHTWVNHATYLFEFVQNQCAQMEGLQIVAHESQSGLVFELLKLCANAGICVDGVILLNELPRLFTAVQRAPYPDAGHAASQHLQTCTKCNSNDLLRLCKDQKISVYSSLSEMLLRLKEK